MNNIDFPKNDKSFFDLESIVEELGYKLDTDFPANTVKNLNENEQNNLIIFIAHKYDLEFRSRLDKLESLLNEGLLFELIFYGIKPEVMFRFLTDCNKQVINFLSEIFIQEENYAQLVSFLELSFDEESDVQYDDELSEVEFIEMQEDPLSHGWTLEKLEEFRFSLFRYLSLENANYYTRIHYGLN